MPTLVSTGQITIVDQNDARPITAYITASPGTQQVYSKDDNTIVYTPDWTTANSNAGLVLTAKVFLGGVGEATDITGQLSARRWSLNLSTAITGTNAAISGSPLDAVFVSSGGTFTAVNNSGGSTLTIKANMLATVAQSVIYFDGDYTDPTTGLVARVVAQISLNRVTTGTNAVYVLTSGSTAIEAATGGTKNVAVVKAELIRASGPDTSDVDYKWYQNNATDQITNANGAEFGLKTTASGAVPTGAVGDIGATNLPASGAWSDFNTLVIHESAVNDLEVFKVVIRDKGVNPNIEYQAYFTIYDVSDPYDVQVQSSSGDKLQNGVGSTTLTPRVWNGDTEVTNLTGWTFDWFFYNRNGHRGAFIDTNRTAVATGRNITGNSAGTASIITYENPQGISSITGWSAGQAIKVVLPSGVERYYEVNSGTGNTVTIKTPTSATGLSFTDHPAPTLNELAGAKLFAAFAKITTNAGDGLVVSGYDVDVKARILCEAKRP